MSESITANQAVEAISAVETIKSAEAMFSPESLGQFLDLPVRTVYQWNSRGTGPPRIRVGRHVRYRRADVEAWLSGNYADGTPAA